MKLTSRLFTMASAMLLIAGTSYGANLLQIDTDGADDDTLTFNSRFSFGGDTTMASQSSPSVAPLLPEADSIFGGNGAADADTYVYTYDPAVDGDNLSTAGVELGVDLLGGTAFGTGMTAGGVGDYYVYAAWPATSNISGGLTNYNVSSASVFDVSLNANEANDPDGDDANDVWVRLGVVTYDGTSPIVVTQRSSDNTFVSMRASAVLFEPVPEPAGMGLALLALGGLAGFIRRR